jgi:hypothetical protein
MGNLANPDSTTGELLTDVCDCGGLNIGEA